jgi:hypothetical protein
MREGLAVGLAMLLFGLMLIQFTRYFLSEGRPLKAAQEERDLSYVTWLALTSPATTFESEYVSCWHSTYTSDAADQITRVAYAEVNGVMYRILPSSSTEPPSSGEAKGREE